MGVPKRQIAALRRRTGSSGGFVAVSLAVVLLTSTLAAVFGNSVHSRLVNLVDGHGWLSDRHTGSVFLANGATGKLDLQLDVKGATGDHLQVLQAGNTAALVDKTNETVSTVDLSQFKVNNSRRVGSSGSTMDVETAPNAIYVIDKRHGTIQARNPVSNRAIGSFSVGGGSLTAGVIDASGRLWSVDTSTGTLVSATVQSGRLERADGSQILPKGAPPTQIDLMLVHNDPAVLDLANRKFVDAPGGATGTTVSLPIPTGLTTQAVEIPAFTMGWVVPIAVDGSGAGFIDVSSDRASQPVTPPGVNRSDSFGEPQAFAGRFYVPDLSLSEVLVLSEGSNQQVQVAAPPIVIHNVKGEIDTSLQGGYLWLDNPDGSNAVVIGKDGIAVQVDKADPTVISNVVKPLPPIAPTSPVAPQAPPPQQQLPGNQSGPTVAPQKPSAPASVTATASNASATITWSGTLDNGSSITSYGVSWKVVGGGSGKSGSEPAQASPITVTGLTNGTSYLFSVDATNAVGTGPPTAAANPVTPSGDVPDAPSGVAARANSDGTIFVHWTEGDAQGHNISSNKVLIRDTTPGSSSSNSGGGTVPVDGSTTSVTLDSSSTNGGLILGNSYTFTVIEVNDVQNASSQSGASSPVTAHTVPLAVANLTVTQSGQGSLKVAWVCDPSNAACSGGSQVTSFNIGVTPTLAPAPGPVPAVVGTTNYTTTLSGLTPSATYTISVWDPLESTCRHASLSIL